MIATKNRLRCLDDNSDFQPNYTKYWKTHTRGRIFKMCICSNTVVYRTDAR